MILRSVTKHVRDQNWFAVGIDFLIVVLGVFVGLQVQEWNTNRQFDAQERVFLAELRSEIASNNAHNDGRRRQMSLIIASGERTADALNADSPCRNDCKPLVVDAFIASQVMFNPVSGTVYEEMQRLGLPRSEVVRTVVERFYASNTGMAAAFESSRPDYRVRIRGHLTIPAQRTLWRDCTALVGGVEVYDPGCTIDLGEEEAKAIAQAIHADGELLRHLNYWIGMNILWEPLLGDVVKYGESAIDAIDAELDRVH